MYICPWILGLTGFKICDRLEMFSLHNRTRWMQYIFFLCFITVTLGYVCSFVPKVYEGVSSKRHKKTTDRKPPQGCKTMLFCASFSLIFPLLWVIWSYIKQLSIVITNISISKIVCHLLITLNKFDSLSFWRTGAWNWSESFTDEPPYFETVSQTPAYVQIKEEKTAEPDW